MNTKFLSLALWIPFLGLVLSDEVSKNFPDVLRFEKVIPRLKFQNFDRQGELYPSQLTVEVDYRGATYVLDLEVNSDLFAPEWSLQNYDSDGKLVFETADVRPFMCHYYGTVRGEKGSSVVMSICDQLGMRGTIRIGDLHLETQHLVPLSQEGFKLFHSEEHIIYDLNDTVLEHSALDFVDNPASNKADLIISEATNDFVAYTCRAQLASDSFRMNAFSSGTAEAQNSQAVMNQAGARYRNTRWNAGADTLALAIAGQTQNPAGWTHSATMSTKLQNLARYKQASFGARANLIGLTHFSYGGTIGLAYLNTMCQAANSCGLNNVGYSTSDNNRGVLIAHEIGHNFSFDHDSAGNGGNGFVMWPSLITSATSFSSFSQNRFRTNAPRYTCLR